MSKIANLAVLSVITFSLTASAVVQEQAHYSLKGAGGIRDTMCPERLKDQAGKSPDLERQGALRVMSNGPECRRQEYDSSIKFEEANQCYRMGKNLVGGDNFVLEVWAYALSAARDRMSAFIFLRITYPSRFCDTTTGPRKCQASIPPYSPDRSDQIRSGT